MCARCVELECENDALRVRVAELESDLTERMQLPSRIFRAMKVTASQAYILAALYAAKDYITRLQLDQATPIVKFGAVRDQDFRTLSGISVFIWQLKKDFGGGFIDSRRGSLGGYKLTVSGRARIRAALEKLDRAT